MEPTENDKVVISDRATAIESGGLPLTAANVPLGLNDKPDPMLSQRDHALVSNWTFAQLLAQRKLVGTFSITPSTPKDKPVWRFVHTMQNVVDMHFRSLKGLFHLWRWNLHFFFEFRSNFQQVGQCLIVNHTMPQAYIRTMYPSVDDPEAGPADPLYASYKYLTQLSHRKIFMGEDVDVGETLRWDAPIEATISVDGNYDIPTASGKLPVVQYDMGEIFVIVPFEMQVAQGVNPLMTVRIWSYLTDVGMSAYTPTDNIL